MSRPIVDQQSFQPYIRRLMPNFRAPVHGDQARRADLVAIKAKARHAKTKLTHAEKFISGC